MLTYVAPYTGAWIEIPDPVVYRLVPGSLPTRERGLKYKLIRFDAKNVQVAPYTGAWIEINYLEVNWIRRYSRSLHGSVD